MVATRQPCLRQHQPFISQLITGYFHLFLFGRWPARERYVLHPFTLNSEHVRVEFSQQAFEVNTTVEADGFGEEPTGHESCFLLRATGVSGSSFPDFDRQGFVFERQKLEHIRCTIEGFLLSIEPGGAL